MRINLFAIAVCLFALLPLCSRAEEPTGASVCQVMSDPAAYNHKFLRISGSMSYGFEDFVLSDQSCKKDFGIWLEIGGTKRAGVMYCCGVGTERTRKTSLVVEGISTPLDEGYAFPEFFDAIKSEPYVHGQAIFEGTYFSGEKTQLPGGTFWMGYGHMGMFSLFVIQKVVHFEADPKRPE